jgi:phosphoglycolate phosphatase
VNYALSSLDLGPVEPDQVRRTIGLPLGKTLEYLTGLTDPDLQERFRVLFVEQADRVMVEQTDLIEGVVPALDALREQGMGLGIVSTKYRYRIESILRRHGALDCIDTIVGGEDTATSKPDPEGLHQALKALRVSAADAVYVGDHPVDAEAASLASVPFVGVLSGTAEPNDFRPFPHIAILAAAPELPRFFGGRPA